MSLFTFNQSRPRTSAEMRLYHGLMGMAVRCKTLDPPVLVADCCTKVWLVKVTSRSSFTPAPVLMSVKGLRKECVYPPFAGP